MNAVLVLALGRFRQHIKDMVEMYLSDISINLSTNSKVQVLAWNNPCSLVTDTLFGRLASSDVHKFAVQNRVLRCMWAGL